MAARAPEDPAIVITCPGCSAPGQVRFSQLPNVIHCPRCDVRFWIDGQGKVRSERDSTHVRFVCPRCGHREKLPAEFVSKGATCGECGGRFYPGDDGQFHASNELRPAQTRKPAQPKWTGSGGWHHRPRTRWALAVAGVLGCGLPLAGLLGWRSTSEESPGSAAVRFTEDCLTNRTEAARARVAPGQERQFRQWCTLVFPQLADPPEPATSHADVSVFQISAEGPTARIRLVIGAQSRGSRLVTQHWRQAGDRWVFDPVRTLAAIGRQE
ncbi:MAG: hypothetical protein ACOY3P_15160 [Planctomycetota bacterium]